jgi:hypothetical protein
VVYNGENYVFTEKVSGFFCVLYTDKYFVYLFQGVNKDDQAAHDADFPEKAVIVTQYSVGLELSDINTISRRA